VREAANRASCANNLHQLGIAVHSCHDANNVLPPASGPFAGLNGNNTAFFWLLNYLEEASIYQYALTGIQANNTINPNWQPNKNPPPAEYVVKTFICPSDATIDGSGHPSPDWPGNMNALISFQQRPGLTSYSANAQAFGIPVALPLGSATAVYPNPAGAARIPGSFPDGTTQTILFAERYGSCLGSGGGRNSNAAGSAWGYANISQNNKVLYPSAAPNANFAAPNVPYSYFDPSFGIYTTTVYTTQTFAVKPISSPTGNCDYHIPSSPHTGGINVGLADGSVKFVSNGVSPTTWWNAIMPNDGQTLGADW
jgi:prepilin-type processing-associated H-X9-DG protein